MFNLHKSIEEQSVLINKSDPTRWQIFVEYVSFHFVPIASEPLAASLPNKIHRRHYGD